MLKKTAILLICLTFVGCAAHNKKQPVTRRGEVVAEGTGPLSFRAPERGMVSVYNANINAVIHSSGVGPNSVIALNPTNGNITMTDTDHAGMQNVYSGLNKSHRHEIWFIPARGSLYTTAPAANR